MDSKMQLFAKQLTAVKTPFSFTDGLRAAQFADLQAEAAKLVLSPIQASKNSRYAPFLRNAIAQARRAGFEISPESSDKVSLTALDKQLKASGLDIESRIELKAALAAAGLLL
jgi:hypothetical protein